MLNVEEVLSHCNNFPNLIKHIKNGNSDYFEYQPGDGTRYAFSFHKLSKSIDSIVKGINGSYRLVVLHNLTYRAYPISMVKSEETESINCDPYYIIKRFGVDEYTGVILLELFKDAYNTVKNQTQI